MNILVLQIKEKIYQPIDLSKLSEINDMKFDSKRFSKISVTHGGKNYKLKDFFSFHMKMTNEKTRKIIIKGSNSFFNNLGSNWSNDDLEIYGDAGSFIGKGMKGGNLKINGSCENFLGSEMKGGSILVTQNAKDYIGAPSFGQKTGMNGGNIFITGNAGSHLGYFMRRGLISVEGNVGEYCANNIVAGTIIIKQKIGKYFCMGMKRGTIILFKSPKNIEKNFETSGVQELNFFSTLQRHYSLSLVKNDKLNRFEKFVKGNSNSGLGEILVVKR